MNKIKVLDPSIFNRIAAGEVVESPASVVKELVENSIDAGATSISISIAGGGIDCLQVQDNGKGIPASDITTAFLPHATSKVNSLNCLNAIATLGFRGEALPSIASVANITLTSKTAGQDLGYSVQYDNGCIIDKGEVGADFGTLVVVKDLFSKIPARKKFLKKPSAEASKITDLVKKLILANPSICFKYIVDNDIVFNTDGKGANSAVYAVYGDIIEQMMPISHTMSGITLSGFTSTPSLTKHNRTYQTIIVNNRVVENDDIAYSIFLAYKDFLMTRRYPVYVLYINIPFDLIDVNVSPNKMQVKFVDATGIKKMAYNAVRRVAMTPSVDFSFLENRGGGGLIENGELRIENKGGELIKNEDLRFKNEGGELKETTNNKINLEESKVFNNPNNTSPFSLITSPLNNGSILRETPQTPPITRAQVLDDIFGLDNFDNTAKQQNFDLSVKIIGTFFETYIAVSQGTDVFLIDQHAAHERLLYDKLIENADKKAVVLQPLLIPYDFTLSLDESEFLKLNLQELKNLGFEIIDLGDCKFSLSKVPAILSNIKLQEFVSELLSNPHQKIKTSDFIKEKIAYAACRAAIKAGDSLSKQEISNLLLQMQNNGTTPQCPHGRPIIIKLTKHQIEEWFKRV